MRWVIALIVVGSAGLLSAQNDENLKSWNDFYAKRTSEYKLKNADDSDTKLQLHSKPLLAFTNPIRGRDQHGAIFAWTLDGRPQCLSSIWSISSQRNPTRLVSHEVHSLSDNPLRVRCEPVQIEDAMRANEITWDLEPAESGIELQVPNALKPAETATRRLLQMRRIADQLSGVVIERNTDTERDLRCMTSPLMRYTSPSQNVLDGCVFSLVLATDPEILVVLEAIQGDKESHWEVRPARFTGTGLRLSFGGDEIWKADPINYRAQSGPYRLRVGLSELPIELSDSKTE